MSTYRLSRTTNSRTCHHHGIPSVHICMVFITCRETDEEVLDHLKGVFDLKDKIVMVTGAAGGVGRAAALGFATWVFNGLLVAELRACWLSVGLAHHSK